MSTLTASRAMADSHRRKAEASRQVKARQDAERARAKELEATRLEIEQADSSATRARIREVIAGEEADQVEEVERGPVRLLARDGLLWLVAKRRINVAQRMAAEHYRGHYAILFASHIRSCLADTIGGGASPLVQTKAITRDLIERAREKGLSGDQALIWLVDEVCGKGSTLRELARDDKHAALALEIELRVALRLLARHYGYAT
jgi:hypothetical protein